MSQQPNPPDEPDAASGSFSIRRFVALQREKHSGMSSWPFGEKSLEMLVKHGLTPNDVLPPIELPAGTSQLPHDQSPLIIKDPTVKEADMISETDNRVPNECETEEEGQFNNVISIDEEGNQQKKSNNIPDHKRKRGRRGRAKNKTRSMVDILAEAKHCTIEDVEIFKVDKFCYADIIDSSDAGDSDYLSDE